MALEINVSEIRKLFNTTNGSHDSRKSLSDTRVDRSPSDIKYIRLATFLYYTESRNTWGGKYNYVNHNSFHYDLDLILKRIRIAGKAGSTFHIQTHHALCLIGSKGESLVVVDAFDKNKKRASFLEQKKEFKSQDIFDIAEEIISHDSTLTSSTFLIDEDEIPNFFAPGWKYPPIRKGSSTYDLRSSVIRLNEDLSQFFSVVNHVNRLLIEPL